MSLVSITFLVFISGEQKSAVPDWLLVHFYYLLRFYCIAKPNVRYLCANVIILTNTLYAFPQFFPCADAK